MKTTLMLAIALGATLPAATALTPAPAATLVPVHLRCDGMANPIGATATPRLSWRVESPERNQAQAAFQILVASRAELLAEGTGDLWDSGKSPTTRLPYVPYAGTPLATGTIYHWKVRCWDSSGRLSPWSEPATWEVAPGTPDDWLGARWIDDGRDNPAEEEDLYLADPAPLLRHEFSLTKPVLRARLHVAGLGYCLPSLNGDRLADQVLDPPWTAFDKRILFRTHDVTQQLAEGQNCLGLALGNGWFNPLPLRMWGHRNIRGSMETGRPRAIACLVVEHPDGSQTTVTTGPGWTTAPGPTLRNSIFLGEERDARLALPGWDKPGYSASDWKAARITEDSLQPLQPILDMPPVREIERFPVTSIKPLADGGWIVDFGINFTGVPEIDLDVPAGTRMMLRFGEILNADGTLNPLTSVCGQIKGTRKNAKGEESLIGGPGAPNIAWQQDIYHARGGGKETYRPDFTFHAFRYMEITGLPEAPNLQDISGIRLNSELPETGSFSSSNELLNRIQQVTLNTFLNNVVSVQSDCPHRERFGYGGDIAVTSEAYLMNYDMAGFYAKTVRDWADGARPDGNFTDTAPFVGVQYCGVGWAMAHPLLLEQLYQHHGDARLIKEQLPAAIRWFDLEASKRKDGLVTYGLGDHEALKRIAGPVLTTPMFIDTARRMARLARIIGNEPDALRFDLMAVESTAAWTAAFLDPKSGKIGGGSQSEQVMALGFEVVPEAARDAVFENLVALLNAPEDGPSLSTGIFGTRFLLEQLSQRGRHDLAYALAERRTFPSWGWMLENGATSLWETWAESDNTFSHNHPMFGSISAWFFRHLGGIQAAEDAVGFDRIVIRPQPVPGLDWVKTAHRSVRGPIESNWTIKPDASEFEIIIPQGTTATIELPAAKGDTVTESGRALTEAPGLAVLPGAGAIHRFQVGGGHYRFTIRKPAAGDGR